MLLRLALVLAALFFFAPPSFSQDFEGKPIRHIDIQGVMAADQQHLLPMLPLKENDVYSAGKVRDAIQVLYQTGRFYDIQADARLEQGGVVLTFITQINYFVGGVFVEDVPAPPSETEQSASTKLELGTLLTDEKQMAAIEGLKRVMQDNGLYQAQIQPRIDRHAQIQQADVHFKVDPGERARIAGIEVTGSPVFPLEQVRKASKLKAGQTLTAKRLQNSLGKLRSFYQKKDYLEASIGIKERRYLPDKNQVVVVFAINAGEKVAVRVAGARLSGGKRRQLIPIYEEGAVDADLIREGEINLRDHLQAQGRFEAEVTARTEQEPSKHEMVVQYSVEPGHKHRVVTVLITGNRYFSEDALHERMYVTAKGFLGSGRFSRAYMSRDVEAITNLYIANGFEKVNVTSEVLDDYHGKTGDVAVIMHIEEGPQTLVRNIRIEGNAIIPTSELESQLSESAGQPYSEFNVLLDRDAVLTYYFNRGFRQAAFVSETQRVPGSADRVDLVYQITEGTRRYIDRVIVTGLDHTRQHVVDRQLRVKDGEPLSRVDLLDTQRNLYDLGIFQSVDTAVQNPDGREPYKNIILQLTEARRWTLQWGFGADIARFGGNTSSLQNTNGKAGVSPRVSFDVTRLNFRGLGHTLSFKSTVSTLQKRALATYTAPHVFNHPTFTLLFNGYVDQRFDVLTFESRRQEGSIALEDKPNKSDTWVFRYTNRRVTAQRDTLKVSVNLIPLFARPVRIGIFGASFVRDRRDDPTDTHRGMYLTVDSGLASRELGGEADFGRIIMQYSTYYRLSKKLVLARSTQFGMAEPFGPLHPVEVLDQQGNPQTIFTRDIPLPERFFSGGGNSHRGFGVNEAGPRDLSTGFPIGGDALMINNVELRFPLIGSNIGGAVFHDMGNVYSDVHHLSFRYHQRNLQDFDYMVHAVGFGVRYKTPIGPVRLDLAYSLNPAKYFGLTGTTTQLLNGTGIPQIRHSNHIQFFFSIGQTF